MFERNFQVIDGKCIVLKGWLEPRETFMRIITEHCPFCSERHFHGAGGLDDWRDGFSCETGKPILAHRSAHCVPLGKKITAPDGTVLSNWNGYCIEIDRRQYEDLPL